MASYGMNDVKNGMKIIVDGYPCTIVDTGVRKPLDLQIQVPVESMVEPEQTDAPSLDPLAGGEATRTCIPPASDERTALVDRGRDRERHLRRPTDAGAPA